MDFVSERKVTGRRLRALAIVGGYSRECPTIEMDTSLGGARAVELWRTWQRQRVCLR